MVMDVLILEHMVSAYEVSVLLSVASGLCFMRASDGWSDITIEVDSQVKVTY